MAKIWNFGGKINTGDNSGSSQTTTNTTFNNADRLTNDSRHGN